MTEAMRMVGNVGIIEGKKVERDNQIKCFLPTWVRIIF